jgi:predicted small metal-binding protein
VKESEEVAEEKVEHMGKPHGEDRGMGENGPQTDAEMIRARFALHRRWYIWYS